MERVAKNLADSFRLDNILTPQEFKEVQRVLRNLKVPNPDAIDAGAYRRYMSRIADATLKVLLRDAEKRIYYEDDLELLLMTPDFAHFRNKKIVRKLEETLEHAKYS